MSRSALRVTVIAYIPVLLAIAGCASMGALDKPPPWCTAPHKKITCSEGDDLVQCHAEMTQELEREKSKRRCLQKYAVAVSG